MTILFYIFLFLFLGLCSLLCLVILVQESKSLGLGASFGGDAGEALFGTSTAAVLKKIYGIPSRLFFLAPAFCSLFWSSHLGRTHAFPPPTEIEESLDG